MYSEIKAVHLNNKDYIVFLILVICAAGLRILTGPDSELFYDFDAGSYALASEDYDLSQSRPHLPGYYLHVGAVLLLNNVTGSAHCSLLSLSVFYSSLGIALFYLICLKWFSRKLSIYLALIIMTNPLVWFFGSTTGIYSFSLAFACALFLAGSSRSYIYITPLILAIALGVRPSSGVLLLPVYLYAWYINWKAEHRTLQILLAQLLCIVLCIAWFLPMAMTAGGVAEYFELYATNPPTPQQGIGHNAFFMIMFSIWGFMPVWLLFPIAAVNKYKQPVIREGRIFSRQEVLLLLMWFIIPMAFYLFYHISKAYVLLCLPPLYLLIGCWAINNRIKQWVLPVIVAIQLIIFMFMPYREYNPEIHFNNRSRSMSSASIMQERLITVYAHGYRHLNFVDKVNRDIHKALEESAVLNKVNAAVVLDNSLPVRERSLQVNYPGLNIITIDKSAAGALYLYHGLDQYKISIDRLDQNNLYLLCSVNFSRKYLSKYSANYYGNVALVEFDNLAQSREAIVLLDGFYSRNYE